MKRVCFLGNSHVGCIRQGVDAVRTSGVLGDFDISVFGARGDKLKHCTVEDGKILPNSPEVERDFTWTSGGRDVVELSHFDQVFLFLGASPANIDGFLAREPATRQFDLPVMTDQILSRIFDSTNSSWPIKLAKDIAAASPDVSVKFIGRPFKSADSPTAKSFLRRLKTGDSDLLARLDRVNTAIDENCADTGLANLEFLRPADELLEEHRIYTRGEFCRDSIRLARKKQVKHARDDYYHMNAKYGEVMVSHLLGLSS